MDPYGPPEGLSALVHGFKAEDWWACWNLHLRGTLFSIDLANQIEFGGKGVGELSLQELRTGAFGGAALSPRMICLSQAAIIRSGGCIGEGMPPYPIHKATPEEAERVVRRADLELRMEAARRELAPKAPSRIACLYLAEDTSTGRTIVSRLKGHETFVMRVRIVVCGRLGRADSRWLDGPIGDEQIAGYWSGSARDGAPAWEYLLDGQIECTDPEELQRLRDWAPEAGVRASGSQGPIGTPSG